MKKIKYDRDKTKDKRNNIIDDLKQDGDDVCSAVLDSFSNDYLSYISGLVKASKTPQKNKIQQVNHPPLTNGSAKENDTLNEIKNIPINSANQIENKQPSPKQQQQHNDTKNFVPSHKKIKQSDEQNQINQPYQKQRDKPEHHQSTENKQTPNQQKKNKQQTIIKSFNRYSTQEAQKIFHKIDNHQVSIEYQTEKINHITNLKSKESKQKQQQFIKNLNSYLLTLESQRYFKKNDKKSYNKIFYAEQQIKNYQDIYQENIKFRKKIKKYQQKINLIQTNMKSHFMQEYTNVVSHCKKQQKTYKLKINQLTEMLFKAVQRVSQQKQQIQQMKTQLKLFGRKAQHCIQKYQNQSSDSQQEIHESLLKAVRPSRAHSEYKIKRKLNLPFIDFIDRQQQ